MSVSPRPDFGWQARYDEGRAHWQRPGTNPAFDAWAEAGLFTPGEAVLVPGCGRSHELLELARRGCDVTGVDLVPAAIEVARQRLAEAELEADLVQADLLTWQPERRFDLVYEQTCLCALHPTDWEVYAERLHRWLRPGGRLCALFMQTGREGGPPFDSPVDRMRELFSPDRWAWPEGGGIESPHPAREGLHELGFLLTRRP